VTIAGRWTSLCVNLLPLITPASIISPSHDSIFDSCDIVFGSRTGSIADFDQSSAQSFPHPALFPAIHLARISPPMAWATAAAYNLACYSSQLQRFDEAQKWLKQAMALDEATVQQAACDDKDLKPLWDNMGGTMWKLE
jgi:hypothetical protein